MLVVWVFLMWSVRWFERVLACKQRDDVTWDPFGLTLVCEKWTRDVAVSSRSCPKTLIVL